MASSVNVKSGHGRALVSIVLVQSLLIVWLSVWAVEDYINNQYVRAYVDGVIQAEGWVFGSLILLGLIGSITGVFVKHRGHAEKSVELVAKGVKPAISTPVAVSTGSVGTGPKPSEGLHPAVAALKAELSERRMSLGLESATAGPGQQTPASGRFEDQRPVAGQPGPGLQPMSLRPGAPVLGMQQQVIGPRPGQAGGPVVPPAGPMLRVEGGTPPAGVMPQQPGPPVLPQNVSTVITGIVPAQQKKKDSEGSSGQGQSQK